MSNIDSDFGVFDAQSSVTITVLPVSLSLVHIPRPRLPTLTRPIIRLLLQTNPTFLNISCNDTEVSIIAEEVDVRSFVRIAREDAKSIQRNKDLADVVVPGGASKPSKRRDHKPVEVSASWSALQIDSHGDQLGDASARIREISALLSGISILYQSSYTTDFIFVQSKLLPEVLSILSNANFLSLASVPSDLTSQISSLVSSSSDSSTRSSSPSPLDFTDTLLGLGIDGADDARVRSRRGTASSHASLHSLLLAKSARVSLHGMPSTVELSPPLQDVLPPIPPTLSLHEMPTPTPTPAPPQSTSSVSSIATNRPQKERSLFSPCRPNVSILPTDLVVVGLSEQSDHLVEAWSMKLVKLLLFRETLSPFSEAPSDAKRGRERRKLSLSDGILFGFGRSDEDSPESSGSSLGDYTDSDEASSSGGSFHSAESSPSRSPEPTRRQTYAPPLPFFSLTRTADETSLTSDMKLLAALFPPHERDAMVLGGDVLDRSDDDEGSPREGGETVFKCLHVNLEDYGLDRHGLVNRFSDVLHSNDIHHLYCSTFKTANLLVDERHAERAQVLLREC